MIRHILLVETNSTSTTDIRRRLEQRSLNVVRCEDPTLVIDHLKHHFTDLIILHGADQPAWDACLHLKLDTSTCSIPLLLLSSSQEYVRPKRYLRARPEFILRSAFTPESLEFALTHITSTLEERLREGIVSDLFLELASELDSLEDLCRQLPLWLTGCGLTTYQVQQVTHAVREICANAIEWGHGYDPAQTVTVHCQLDMDKVSILISDCGPGFDPRNLPHAARPGDTLSHLSVRAERNLREGGFGILMATGLVDQLCFSQKGNESLLLKYLPTTTTSSRSCSHRVTVAS